MQESEILTNHQTPAVAIAIYGRQATDWCGLRPALQQLLEYIFCSY